MTLKIISSTDVIFKGEVTSVTLPGTMGAFTVLRNHASLVSTLAKGTVRYTTSAGEEKSLDIPGGLVDVDNNVVSACIY
ncbi:MAG: F0F1 ATP synthase subunit epsilon [Muribaculaceae bacterium]